MIRALRARSEGELELLGEWLHDAAYSTSAVRWDRRAGTVALPLAQSIADPDLPARRPIARGLWSESFLLPWFRAHLTFRAVRSMRPDPAHLVEPGLMDGVEWRPGHRLVRVASHNGDAGFELEVDELDLELVATAEIEHWRIHRYGRILRWESHGEALDEAPPGDSMPDMGGRGQRRHRR